MINKLSEIYGKNNIFFPKYPEPWKDFSFWDNFQFYAWNYWPEVIHTEEARYLPITWNMNVIIWKEVLSKDMIDYYSYMFSDTFSRENIISYKWKEYYDIINNLPRYTLITPQPYKDFKENLYAINPNTTYNLNSKDKMEELTSQMPRREILNTYKIKKLTNFPFVLKSNSGASWDWVRIIKSQKNLKDALEWFKTEKSLIVEEYIEEIWNFWVQILIPQKWNIEILALTRQITSKKWEYEWSFIDNDEKISEKLKEICIEIWENAQRKWFFWVAWLDFLQDKNWNFFFIDPNFRVTWATNLVLLHKKILKNNWKKIVVVWQFKNNWWDFWELIDKANNNEIYLMSAFKDQVKNIINWFCVYSLDTIKNIEKYKSQIKNLWINL